MAKPKLVVIDGQARQVSSDSRIIDVVPDEVTSVVTHDYTLIPRAEFSRVPVPQGFQTNLSAINKGGEKKLVVKDCTPSKNLYKVSDYRGTFYVYRVDPGFFSDDLYEVGTTRSFGDALELVKAASGGKRIDISEW